MLPFVKPCNKDSDVHYFMLLSDWVGKEDEQNPDNIMICQCSKFKYKRILKDNGN